MEACRELKDKTTRIKEQIALVNSVLSGYQRKVLATEEIVWDLKKSLDETQQELISRFKGLSKDEVLAIRSGLSVKDIRRGKALLAQAKEEATGGGKD